MTDQIDPLDVEGQLDKTIIDMLALEPNCALNVHIVDTDEMGVERLPKILENIPTRYVIGVPTAVVRHRLAFNLGLEPSVFSFVRENKSDLEKVLPAGTSLILWDYLRLSQPLAQKLVYKNWEQVDLVVLLRHLHLSPDLPEISLRNLLV